MTAPSPSGAPMRRRADRCPGVLRPWPAADGALVRVRVVGGRLTVAQLQGLVALAQEYGDGDLHLTSRANVQIRGLADPVPQGFVSGVRELGLLPSDAHERMRNILVSPLSGISGGRVDMRASAASLDRVILDNPRCAGVSARFLFALDDGRGDLHDRPADLGAIALDAERAQLRIGAGFGPVVPLARVPAELARLTERFVEVRGTGPAAAWHVTELAEPLVTLCAPEPEALLASDPPPYGPLSQDDGRTARHVGLPDGLLTSDFAADLLATATTEVVVTPWRSVVVPHLEDL